MPKPERFEARNGYYATVFHELTHATGHSSRLDRKLDTKRAAFGSGDYSREELVAEMGSAFLCGEAGKLDLEGIGSDRLKTQVAEEISAIDARIRRTLHILGRLEKHLSSRS